MANAVFSRKKALFFSKLNLYLRTKRVKCYIWSRALFVAETWELRKLDQESFETCCWRRMEKISWTDSIGNEQVLLRVK